MQENYYQSIAPFFHLEYKVREERLLLNCGHRYLWRTDDSAGGTQKHLDAAGCDCFPGSPREGSHLFTDLFFSFRL